MPFNCLVWSIWFNQGHLCDHWIRTIFWRLMGSLVGAPLKAVTSRLPQSIHREYFIGEGRALWVPPSSMLGCCWSHSHVRPVHTSIVINNTWLHVCVLPKNHLSQTFSLLVGSCLHDPVPSFQIWWSSPTFNFYGHMCYTYYLIITGHS